MKTNPDYGLLEYAANSVYFTDHALAAARVLLTHVTLEGFSEIPKLTDGLLRDFIKQESPHLLELFLEKGIEPSQRTITLAIYLENDEILDLLLEKVPAVGPKTRFGSNFLVEAARHKREDIIQRLDEKGAEYDGPMDEMRWGTMSGR